jgi:hypothetical protein
MVSDDQILELVFNLFGWLYQADLPMQFRQAIEQQVRSGWHNQDHSEQQFISFLVELSNKLNRSGNPESYRNSVLAHFRNEFASAEQTSPYLLNDKGRLLLVIHGAIEVIRPGCTGVPSAVAQAAQGGPTQPSYPAPQPASSYGNEPDRQPSEHDALQERMQKEFLVRQTLANINEMRASMLAAVAAARAKS